MRIFKGLNSYMVVGLSIILAFVVIAVLADVMSPYSPIEAVGALLSPPSPKHPMGTDNLGRDVLSRVFHGTRTIFMVVLVSIALSGSVGTLLGLLSGYRGGTIDRVLSFVMDAIYAFPSIILAIALSVALGASPMNAAMAIAVVYVPTYFRMVRGHVLSIKNESFIEAARALGLHPVRILSRHVLPHLVQTLAVVFSMNSADAVLTEAALSFLGLIVQPPAPDWGFDLYKGRGFILSGCWWLLAFPSLAITLLAIGFALLSEGISMRYGGTA
jgi:peptide/nickel transport system permease protein